MGTVVSKLPHVFLNVMLSGYGREVEAFIMVFAFILLHVYCMHRPSLISFFLFNPFDDSKPNKNQNETIGG